ncbi:MAG TPA: hypothetical protein VMB51_06800 [Solirubrobacteraceae bacterium]|nr:hypothetical protein [Solirubrobacteraceae bacterium]
MARVGRWLGSGAALLAATGVMAGCGSGGSSTTGAPTKAQYVARVTAVCNALMRRTETISEGGHSFEAAVREIVDAHEQADRQLRAIPLPDPSTVPAEWLHWRETATSAMRRAIDAKPYSHERSAASADEFKANEKARAVARVYGLSACLRT